MAGTYNTRGGKNNRWGNTNKKDTGAKDDKKDKAPTYHYEPNKAFSIFIGGVFLLAISSAGFGAISDAISNASNVINHTNKYEVTDKPNTVNNTNTQNMKVTNDIDIGADDVKDILEYIGSLSDSSIEDDIVIMDYSVVKDINTYKKKVINKLDTYKNNVSFALINREGLGDSDREEELDRLNDFISDNIDLLSETSFNKITTSGRTNSPKAGEFTIVLTFNKR